MSQLGQKAKYSLRADVFRFTPRLGDQAAPEPRLIAASSGLVAGNLVEGILGSINPGRRTEPLTSSQGQSSVVTTYDDLPGASYVQILKLIPAFIVVAIDATGLGIILPLLPFYSQRLGATPFIVGSLISVYALCQLVGRDRARKINIRLLADASSTAHRRHERKRSARQVVRSEPVG